jgi:N-methylhydantoinase B
VTTDPLTLAVVKGSLEEVVEEMDRIVERAAFSPVISQARDRASGIYKGTTGEVVVQGESGLPIFIGAMQFSTQAVLEEIGRPNIAPGDLFIVNDPYSGGTHLMDVKLVKPVFLGDDLFVFLSNTGHWIDVGGSVPGGFPVSATEIFQEGLRIPPIKLFDRGVVNQSVLSLILRNIRVPQESHGDLMAMVNALEVGEVRLREVIRRFGRETIEACVEILEQRSEAQMRESIRGIRPGRYSFEDFMDNDGITDVPLRIALDLDVDDGRMRFDLSRSSPPCRGPMNLARATTVSALLVAVKHCFPDVPVNSGCFRPLEFIIPATTFLAATAPRPVSGFAEVTQRVMDVVFGALNQAMPGALFAAPMATANNLTLAGHRADGSRFVAYLFHGGGHGGNDETDGLVHASPTLSISRIQPLEILERRYPIRYLRYAIRDDSAGPGRHRGGCGTEYEFEVLADDVRVSICGDRASFGPFGVAGGGAGARNEVHFVIQGRTERPPLLAKQDGVILNRRDRIIIRSPGGGGYGDPFVRPGEAVAEDVRLGYVRAASAERDYGVVLRSDGNVDDAATSRARGTKKPHA